MGKIVRTISEDASVVCSALDALDIVSEIEKIHKTSAVITAATGRLAIAASLMGMGLKGKEDTLTIRVNGGGPAGSIVAVGDSFGNVKAYPCNPVVELPLNAKGKLDVGRAVGTNGTLSVIKDMGLKEPYVGQLPLVSGEIGEDIASYFAVSEQIPTVCALGVLVNPDLTVRAAGGYLIQLLPFAPDSCIDIIEKNVNSLPSVTQMLDSGMTAEQIAMKTLEGLNPNVLDEFTAEYRCDCSLERVENAIISVGKETLQEMIDDGKEEEVCCHFCGKKYIFNQNKLKALYNKAK